jgi:acyl-coenzyme A thioesterase PaaI-like protein
MELLWWKAIPDARFLNTMRRMHGGFIAALIDTGLAVP